MKRLLLVLSLLLVALNFSELLAQAPKEFSFQAILRDQSGTSLKNQQTTVVISLNDHNTQSLLYRESHNALSDNFGIIRLSVGAGVVVSGDFNNINWSSQQISLAASASLASGVTLNISDQQLHSVPYALHATSASTLSGPNDTDNNNELNHSLILTGNTLRLTDPGGELSADLSALNQDAASVPFQNTGTNLTATHVQGAIEELSASLSTLNNGNQTLSFEGTSLTISGGNSISLAELKEDADANSANELNQNFELTGSTLKITDAGGELSVDLSPTNQIAAQVPYDNAGTGLSSTNVQTAIDELASDLLVVNTDAQTLSFDGTSISISGGNSVNLSALGDDADANSTNEIQHLSINGSTISLSNSDSQINLTALGADADDQNAAQVPYSNTGTQLTSTNVQTAINEIAAALTTVNTDAQTLSFNGTSLSISNGNSIDLSALEDDADANPLNEIQHLSLNGSTISLSGSGAQVNLTGLGVEADDQTAAQVPYNNTGTQLTSTNVQTAINEIATALTTVNTDGQTLTFDGTLLSIAGGNSVDISALEDDGDANPTNEIQHLSLTGSTLSLSGSGAQVNLTGLGVEADDQNAAQVPYDGSGSNMDATQLQEAIDELAAEKVRNLQEAYSADGLITLNGTHEFRINTSTSQPLIATQNTGRVGIGTATPGATLDVSSTGADVTSLFEVSNSDNSHWLQMFPGRTSDPNPFIAVRSGDPLRFATNSESGFTERARIAANGNLGVGISTPQGKLHVAGTTATITGPLDGFETTFGTTTEAGAVFEFTKGSDQGSTAAIAAVMSSSAGTGNAIIAYSNGPEAAINRGMYAAASGGNLNYGLTGNAFHTADENVGLRGLGQHASTINIGVYGTGVGTAGSTNYGGYFTTSGAGNTAIGLYASATGATTNWAGWFQGNVRVQGNMILNGQLTLNGKGVKGFEVGNNIAVGNGLASVTTGQGNIAVGSGLNAVISANDNVGIGAGALNSITNADGNVAIGRYAMTSATGGASNVAVGSEVLRNNTTGNQNIGLGYLMLRSNTTGSNNVALGTYAMDSNVGGSGNVVIGQSAGGSITNSNDNVALGKYANISNSANRAVAIGYEAVAAQDDAIVLGNPYNTNVRVGIGTTAPSQKLHVVGDVLISGSVTATNIAAPSDRRLKTNIKAIPDALNTIGRLNGVSYNWTKDDPATAKTEFGLIAQELEKVIPELVNTNSDGYKSVNYVSLIPFLLEALKEQQQEIKQLKNENSELKSSLEGKLEALTAAIMTLQSNSNISAQSNSDTDDKK